MSDTASSPSSIKLTVIIEGETYYTQVAANFFNERIKELELEVDRIKKISQGNYNRADEINRIRTEELKELEQKLAIAERKLIVASVGLSEIANDLYGRPTEMMNAARAALKQLSEQ